MVLVNNVPVAPMDRKELGLLINEHIEQQFPLTIVRSNDGTWVIAGQGKLAEAEGKIAAYPTWQEAGGELNEAGLGNFIVQRSPTLIIV